MALEGLPCVVRIGRFGAYLETKRVADDGTEELLKATLPLEITPADLDAEKAELHPQAEGGWSRVPGRGSRKPASRCICCSASTAPTCSGAR